MDKDDRSSGGLRVLGCLAAAVLVGLVTAGIVNATAGPVCEFGDPDCEWVRFANGVGGGVIAGIVTLVILLIFALRRR
jgi:hypothetical protein